MRLINRDTDYAVRLLRVIAQHPGKPHDARTLSSRLRVPRPFLRKILQRLSGAGYLASSRGRNGGFFLGRPAEKILVQDLLRLFQGGMGIIHCDAIGVPCANADSCLLHSRLKTMEARFQREIGRLSIRQLAQAQE